MNEVAFLQTVSGPRGAKALGSYRQTIRLPIVLLTIRHFCRGTQFYKSHQPYRPRRVAHHPA
jgi:hypothetical protein